MAQNILRVANYDITLAEATKGIKNPADRAGFERAVRAVNPKYDMHVAQAQAKIMKDLDNPKTELGKLDTVTELMLQAEDLKTSIRALPDWGNPTLNKYIVSPISRFFNPAPFLDAEEKRDQFSKLYDRLQRLSKPSS